MPLFTTLSALSQTAASNPPDGSVDQPSTIDDQLRLLGSFIAQLRDGSGFTVNSLLPPGTGADYFGGTVPSGWLLCDGSAVSRTTYAALFAAIQTTWGAGDGSTTFNLPDSRGRTTIGAGTGSGLTARTLGTQNIGEETHVLTTAELATHNHAATVTESPHSHALNEGAGHAHAGGEFGGSNLLAGGGLGVQARLAGAAGTYDTATATTGATIGAASTGITVANASAGSGTAHNNMQPSAVVNKIIKT